MHQKSRDIANESRGAPDGPRQSLLEPFRRDAKAAGIFLDFDGTLSDIVLIPTDARPAEGARAALHDLGAALGMVVVVSGRAASQLVDWLGASVEIWGTHGAERARNGRIEVSERIDPYLPLMEEVKAHAEEELARLDLTGVILEDKRVVLGLHYRTAPRRDEAEAALDDLTRKLATAHGVRRARGRLVYELRPPVDLSKADVVLRRAREEGLRACMFIGDDAVDLPAFDALDELEREGVHVARVAVHSAEAPAELVERADLVLADPLEVVAFLSDLAGGRGRLPTD